MPVTPQQLTVHKFKRFQKNTLQAFVAFELPGGVIINECLLHENGGRRWVNPPAREYTASSGEKSWMPMVGFADEDARKRFQVAALAAVDEFLGEAR